MVRKKKNEPCEYCECDEYTLLNDNDTIEDICLEMFIDFRTNEIGAYISNNETDKVTEGYVDIQYCPFCGRKLDEH
jgi:hypothetical protein